MHPSVHLFIILIRALVGISTRARGALFVVGAILLGVCFYFGRQVEPLPSTDSPSTSSAASDGSSSAPAPAPAPPVTTLGPADASTSNQTPAPAASDNSSTASTDTSSSPAVTSTTTPASGQSVTDADGKTYRIPEWVSSDLQRKDIVIKELEQTINTDDAQIKTDKQKYEDMGNDLDAKKQSLDNTNQQAIDAYNQEVKDYNNLGHSFNAEVDQRESVYEDYKAKINAYNTELVQNGTLIK